MTDFTKMSADELIAHVNARLSKINPTMHFLRGKVLSFEEASLTVKVAFETHDQLSNGANQVQGGFSAAMLDAACGYLVSAHNV